MRRKLVVLAMVVGAAGGLMSAPASAEQPVVVTSSANRGPGSLRAALATGATQISIAPDVGTINLRSPLNWSGRSLLLAGTGQAVDGNGAVGTLLTLRTTQVQISGMTFRDTAGSAIRVVVPRSATGTATVDLTDVTVEDTALHGVHIDDLAGSSASVQLRTTDVVVSGAGIGESDQDGVRVDEWGEGHIIFSSIDSMYEHSGADGVELDEGGPGDVVFDLSNSKFLRNGPLDPADLDDGIDVDEADAGSIQARITQSTFDHNYDEGIDLNELGPGDVNALLTSVIVVDTVDGDGLQVDEEDAGNVAVSVASSTLVDNDGDDIDLDQGDAGTGVFRLRDSTVGSINLDGVTQL